MGSFCLLGPVFSSDWLIRSPTDTPARYCISVLKGVNLYCKSWCWWVFMSGNNTQGVVKLPINQYSFIMEISRTTMSNGVARASKNYHHRRCSTELLKLIYFSVVRWHICYLVFQIFFQQQQRALISTLYAPITAPKRRQRYSSIIWWGKTNI